FGRSASENQRGWISQRSMPRPTLKLGVKRVLCERREFRIPSLSGRGGVAPHARNDFLYIYAKLRSPTRAVTGAVLALRQIHRCGLVLGIVSNGYPHTAVELAFAS